MEDKIIGIVEKLRDTYIKMARDIAYNGRQFTDHYKIAFRIAIAYCMVLDDLKWQYGK